MKVIKQLSENQFIVELDKDDIDSDIPRVIVAHDYVSFVGQDWHCTDLHITGPHGISNVVYNRAVVQVPIRVAQDMFRTIMKKEYLQKKHLLYKDGRLAYLNEGKRGMYKYRTDDGVDMIAIESSKTGEFTHIPLDVYEELRKSSNSDE